LQDYGWYYCGARNDIRHNLYFMTVHTFQLDEKQLVNLREFMQRVDLKGAEVTAFMELVSVFFPQPKPEAEQK